MALDTIITDGDQVIFNSNFGVATVAVKPGSIKGTGKTSVNGKIVCVKGDEKQVIVQGCSYTNPQFPTPGMGDLTIKALASNQLTRKSSSGGKPMILKGTEFEAVFTVKTKAMLMVPGSPPQSDTTPKYTGKGQLNASNKKIKAI